MDKFKEMEIRNVEVDKIIYMILIQVCYGENDFDVCLFFYYEMLEKGLEILFYVYSLVIGGFCKEGKYV